MIEYLDVLPYFFSSNFAQELLVFFVAAVVFTASCCFIRDILYIWR